MPKEHHVAGHERMQTLEEYAENANGNAERYKNLNFDKELTFDKVTDVFHAGVAHDEDQPSHLHILDTEICATRCAEEFGNPCEKFCPAAVYEMEEDSKTGRRELKVNFSNCVHCKTCDIMDPYQIINWVTPEGGGGPDYKGM
jgi:electron-transferring-flavoprotein dehydrogenase